MGGWRGEGNPSASRLMADAFNELVGDNLPVLNCTSVRNLKRNTFKCERITPISCR